MARSYLFVPGNVPRMLQHAEVFEADALIFDLEDAVSLEEKDEARQLVRSFLQTHPPSQPAYVRVNADALARDFSILDGLPIHGVVLPKASIQTLASLREQLDGEEWSVLALVETPSAFLELSDLARDPGVDGLILGGVDLRAALHAHPTESGIELLYARSRLLMAARAYGIEAIDTPYAESDDAGFETDLKRSVALGFDAKCAIHPNQVPPLNAAFTPSQERIREARRIVERHEQTGEVRFSLDGRMVDRPVLEEAKQLLERAKRYKALKKEADDAD